MKLQDAISLIGTIGNASGQVCQMKDGKPVLILFDLGCSNCSEVASKNADELGEALAAVVNAVPRLAAIEAATQIWLEADAHGAGNLALDQLRKAIRGEP